MNKEKLKEKEIMTKTVISGEMEGSKKYFRSKQNQLSVNPNWGKIFKKLLKKKCSNRGIAQWK